MNNQIAEKIKKLLALANSPNENEARFAATKAQELLLKHNLSMQQVESTLLDYTQDDLLNVNRLESHIAGIAAVLNDYFFVKIVYHRNRLENTKRLVMYGKPVNIETAGYVFGFLVQTYPALWKEFRKNNPNAHRISYYTGLTTGLRQALKDTLFKVQEETGLVLVKDNMLDKCVKTTGEHKQASTSIQAESYHNGVNDGKNIKIRRALGEQINNGPKYLK